MVNSSNRKRMISLIPLLLVALVLMSGSAFAQVAVTGSSTATIVAAISVAATQALAFGNVYPGVPKVQDEEDNANSGVFTVIGLADAGITSQFMLPEYVALASGADRMTISFSAADCAADSSNNGIGTPAANGSDPGTHQNQDPRSMSGYNIGGDGEIRFYLGGKVIPSPYQSAGAYTGDVILTVFYDGT